MFKTKDKNLTKGAYGLISAFLIYAVAVVFLNHQLFIIALTGILIVWFCLVRKFKVSIYLIIFLVLIYLEFVGKERLEIGGRSLQFYLSIIIIVFFALEFLAKRSRFHIRINDKSIPLIILFFFFSFLAMVFSIAPEQSLKNVTTLLQIPFYIVCAEIFYCKKEMLQNLTNTLSILGTVIAIFLLLNYFTFWLNSGYFTVLSPRNIQYPFLIENSNMMAYAILICLQFSLYSISNISKKNLKYILIISVIIMCFAVFLSNSRTGSVLLLLSLLIFFLKTHSKKQFIYILVGLSVSFLLFYYYFGTEVYSNYLKRYQTDYIQEGFEIHRGATWKMALKEFKNRPFFGVGQDVFIWKLHKYYSLTHNTYINILVERGIFTFIFYIWLLIYFFRLARRLETKSDLQDKSIFMALSGVLIVHYLFSLTGDFPNSKFIWLIFSILTAEKTRLFRNGSYVD